MTDEENDMTDEEYTRSYNRLVFWQGVLGSQVERTINDWMTDVPSSVRAHMGTHDLEALNSEMVYDLARCLADHEKNAP